MPVDSAVKKALIAMHSCGNLNTEELGRLVSPIQNPTKHQAMKTGEALRSRMLQMGFITASTHGNRDFRHSLTKAGRDELYKLSEVE